MQSGKIHIFVQAKNNQLCMYGWGADPEPLEESTPRVTVDSALIRSCLVVNDDR